MNIKFNFKKAPASIGLCRGSIIDPFVYNISPVSSQYNMKFTTLQIPTVNYVGASNIPLNDNIIIKGKLYLNIKKRLAPSHTILKNSMLR